MAEKRELRSLPWALAQLRGYRGPRPGPRESPHSGEMDPNEARPSCSPLCWWRCREDLAWLGSPGRPPRGDGL